MMHDAKLRPTDPVDPKRRDRRVMGLDDFTEQDLIALESMEAPEDSKAFNHELKS
jgi:hypothetical protein